LRVCTHNTKMNIATHLTVEGCESGAPALETTLASLWAHSEFAALNRTSQVLATRLLKGLTATR
jgi:hypothetical protein